MSQAGGVAPRDPRAIDQAERALAQREFVRPLLFEAGAGTGKTTVLVTRVLAWCLGPGWERAEAALAGPAAGARDEAIAGRVLERVVAVTFTEAAAAEMEQRIGLGLRALERADGPLPDGLDRDALPPEVVVRRARAQALLAGFDRLRVSTIHAFCRRLLAEHPEEAGVHPRFEVDASGLARAAVAREVVEEWAFEPARVADQALLELFDVGIAAPELEAMLDSLLASAIDPAVFGADPLAPARLAELTRRLHAAADAFLAAEAGALRALRASALGHRVALAVELTGARVARAPADPAALAALVADLGAAWPDNLRDHLATWARQRQKLGVQERKALGDRAEATIAAARELWPLLDHALDLDAKRLACVHRVLAPLYERAAARMRRQGAESFDALLRMAGALLERHPGLTARLRGRIDQLLVDEFQDTDAIQCELIARLAFAPGDDPRPGLFVVGDPKQSIYGWRSADLAAYEAFRERLRAAGGTVHELCVNRRSVPGVLAEVERVIEPVMRAVPGEQPPFAPLLPHREDAGPAVEYWIAGDWAVLCGDAGRTTLSVATDREAERLASDLLRLAREAREAGACWSWSEVGVLLRAMSDVEPYLARLRAAGIPHAVARDRQYARRREIVDARALVRAVLDPGDQIALVAALRSPWAGVPDAAWRPLWQAGLPDAIHGMLAGEAGARERVAAAARGAAAELACRTSGLPDFPILAGWDTGLCHAVEVMAALRRSFLDEPAERFVERLRTLPLLAAGEAARFLGTWRLANLERFFRDLSRLLEESRGDVAGVLRALRRDEPVGDDAQPAQPGGDAVQVMTIHGAKGLEFDHVYLLQVHKGGAGSDREPFRAGDGALEGEWRLGSPGLVATPGYDRVRAARGRCEEHEQVRTLYVAMTRARRRLVVSGAWTPHEQHGVHGRLLAVGRGRALERLVAHGREAGQGWDGAWEHEGARWVVLDRTPPSREAPLEPVGDDAPDERRITADSAGLAALSREAAARAARPLVAAVSAGAAAAAGAEREAEAARAGIDERGVGPAPPDAARAAAAAVGTAIHALLERFDAIDHDEQAWARERAAVHAALARALGPEALAGACARADALLERLRGGRLWRRLRDVAHHVVARELPVLIEPDDATGAVAAWVGVIDLVYRDPADGALVVVDFKTDRIEGRPALDERTAHHRPQALAYGRAVAPLELGPALRVELWFLDADAIVPLS